MAEPIEQGREIAGIGVQARYFFNLSRRDEKHDLSRAIREGAGQGLKPKLGKLADREGQDAGRQATAETGGVGDQLVAVPGLVDQEDRRLAARPAVGGEQRAQALEQGVRTGRGVGGSPGGADAGARTAAGADEGVDRHVVARGRDRTGRAEVEAAGAAGAARAGMGAELGREVDIARLLELADEGGGLQERTGHGGGVPRIGPEIAVAPLVRGEQRRAAGEIEHEIRLEHAGLPHRGHEAQPLAGRRSRRGQLLDLGPIGPEMAGEPAQAAAEDREGADRRRDAVGAGRKQECDREPVRQRLRRLECGLRLAVDEAAALRAQGQGRCRRDGNHGLGEQGRDLGRAAIALVGPAGPLADVGEQDGLGRLAGDLGEERCFLGAGDQKRLARGQGGLVAVELAAAELGVDDGLGPGTQGTGDGPGIQAHRALAIAHQAAAVGDLHRAGLEAWPGAPSIGRASGKGRGRRAGPAWSHHDK